MPGLRKGMPGLADRYELIRRQEAGCPGHRGSLGQERLPNQRTRAALASSAGARCRARGEVGDRGARQGGRESADADRNR